MKKLLSTLVFIVFPIFLYAQVLGDYRSAVTGNWSDRTNWERFNGVTWAVPSVLEGYPGFSGSPTTVTVRESYTITLDLTPAFPLVNLVIDGDPDFSSSGGVLDTSGNPSLTLGGSLTLGSTFADFNFAGSGTMTVAGNISIGTLISSFERAGTGDLVVAGNISVGDLALFTLSTTGNVTIAGNTTIGIVSALTDNENTGVSIFAGLVTCNLGIWTSTAVTTTANMVFRGGITNNTGIFSAGGATFNTNNQALSGTISFANPVNVDLVTVTNSGTITISSTSAGALSGTGTWTQGTGGGGRTLNYAGSTLTVSTFNASSGNNTVNYNASTVAQTIRVPATTYGRLTLNNTFGTSPQLIAAGNITVASRLTMTSGIVNLSGFTFTLGSSGVASTLIRTASTTTNWMYGGSFLRFWLNAAVSSTAGNLYGLFPVGASTASSYRPVAINSTADPTATGSYTVTHTDATSTTDLSPVFNDGGTNIVRKHNAQFVNTISGVTGGTYNVSVTMTGLAAGTLSDIRLGVSNGATTVTTVGTHAAATGTAPNPTAGRTAVTLAGLTGDFRITTSNLTNTPLPIELVSFKAEVVEDAVQLIWETASELNNDFFTVERSATGEVFSSVGQVNGSGTSSQNNTYSLIDANPFYGTSYYRLKQTDFDGTFTHSKIIAITYEGPVFPFLNVYPNPSNGDQVTIEIKGLKNVETVPLVIYDQLGRERLNLLLDVDKNSGSANRSLTFENELPGGMYFVKVGPSRMLVKRFIVTEK